MNYISREEFGFAKVRGHSFWPAKKTGEFNGKIWVNFFGTDQMGTLTKNKQHWLVLSDKSLKRFVTTNTLKRPSYSKAVSEMVNVIKENINIVDFYYKILQGLGVVQASVTKRWP